MAESSQKVIIAVDESPQAEHAAKYYVDHIHKSSNEVILLHVVELPDMQHAKQKTISPTILAELWEKEMVKSRETEKRYRDMMVDHGVEKITMRIDQGMKPGAVVCDWAEKEAATMIVMGTRGMGIIRRTILGSVSDYVIHHAHVPVVICRI